jgi:hypothetical protein
MTVWTESFPFILDQSVVTEMIFDYKTAVRQCPFITALSTEYASQSHEYFINTLKFRNVEFIGNYEIYIKTYWNITLQTLGSSLLLPLIAGTIYSMMVLTPPAIQ